MTPATLTERTDPVPYSPDRFLADLRTAADRAYRAFVGARDSSVG